MQRPLCWGFGDVISSVPIFSNVYSKPLLYGFPSVSLERNKSRVESRADSRGNMRLTAAGIKSGGYKILLNCVLKCVIWMQEQRKIELLVVSFHNKAQCHWPFEKKEGEALSPTEWSELNCTQVHVTSDMEMSTLCIALKCQVATHTIFATALPKEQSAHRVTRVTLPCFSDANCRHEACQALTSRPMHLQRGQWGKFWRVLRISHMHKRNK